MTILVTGASGFVGKAVCRQAVAAGIRVRGAVRATGDVCEGVESVSSLPLDAKTEWKRVLVDCRAVIHAAARVHIMTDESIDPLGEFRRVNVEGSLHLARQAASAGVRRFVFVSSVKVNGEGTTGRKPFTMSDMPAPLDPYGISKAEAEDGLRHIAAETGMEVVIVRPPLVYGPGVKANFAALMRWLQRGIPLPLGAVTHNRRSFVALDNLVDLLITCIDHPAAVNQTFLVSDGEDLSTAALLQRLGRAMGKPARLLPVPPALLKWVAATLGKADVAQRLLGSLQVDITHTRKTLDWAPPISVDEGLRRAVAGLAR